MEEFISEFLQAVPNTFIPLFVAIDIFAVLPIFMALTDEMSQKQKKDVIRQSILTALAVGVVFIAVGEAIFRVLGITADDFKVAGGLVLLVFAVLEITRHDRQRIKVTGTTGVVPIGVPLIVGPAVLTTTLVLVDHYGVLPTIISLMLNLVLVWIAFKGARRIVKFLGKGGIVAISKVMALLLAAIAVMMMRLGLQNIIKGQ
ncbi:MAG: MarC family protein [Thermodesulfovibrionales bacterium]|nr:MarC family protein [Thermodesulfovibrionales bacterium]